MIRSLTAIALSVLWLFAATISLNDEIEPADFFTGFAPEHMELSFGAGADPTLPRYPEAVLKRLLRQRVAPRALIGERIGNVICDSSFCNPVQSFIPRRSSPHDLYQHRTSLRI
ncbi:MAG: hypothetical protein ACREQV_05370 [Candidatus Binatia bacterium]